MIDLFVNSAIKHFKKAKDTESPHRAIFQAAIDHDLDVSINGIKPDKWDDKAEEKYFETGSETLRVSVRKPRATVVFFWEDDGVIVRKK